MSTNCYRGWGMNDTDQTHKWKQKINKKKRTHRHDTICRKCNHFKANNQQSSGYKYLSTKYLCACILLIK